MKANPRRLAAKVVQRVLDEDAWTNHALDAALSKTPIQGPDRGLCTQLVYGTVAWRQSIDTILGRYIKKGGLRRVEPQVAAILRVAVYQLGWLDRVPDHAAVDQAVRHARKVRGKAAGFVNGVLRNALRDRDNWPTPGGAVKNAHELAQQWSIPAWLAERWVRELGLADAAALAEVVARPAPLVLRARTSGARALGGPGTIAPEAVRVPGWSPEVAAALEAGAAAVQDEAAQLVSLLANPRDGARILDACAGLGGKTLHLDDLSQGSHITATDPLPGKLGRIAGSASVEIQVGDVRDLASALGEYDLVVVDAPCSGLGVLRRHPEGRWTRRESDVTTQAALQASILDAVIPCVKPGGCLVYAVCTTTAEEGDRQIEALLERHPKLRLDLAAGSPEVDWSKLRRQTHGYATLPQDLDCDGFFISRLVLEP